MLVDYLPRKFRLDAVDPMIYVPLLFDIAPTLLVRNRPDVLAAVKALVGAMEPRARVSSTPLSQNLDRSLMASRIGAAIAGMLGVVALSLATIGIAGVFAYSVEQRKHEIGARQRSAETSQRLAEFAGAQVAVGDDSHAAVYADDAQGE